MPKLKTRKLRSYLTLFTISILLSLILSTFLKNGPRFLFRLCNNFFIIGVVFLIIGVIFRLFAWSSHKKSLRKIPIDKEELEILKHSHKDAVTISNIKKTEKLKEKKEILGLLWKVFIFIGFVDLLLSIVLLIFL